MFKKVVYDIDGSILTYLNFRFKPELQLIRRNVLSKGFARGATEEAHFFTTPLGPRPASIWLNVEKPILQQNGVSIIIH